MLRVRWVGPWQGLHTWQGLHLVGLGVPGLHVGPEHIEHLGEGSGPGGGRHKGADTRGRAQAPSQGWEDALLVASWGEGWVALLRFVAGSVLSTSTEGVMRAHAEEGAWCRTGHPAYRGAAPWHT